MTRSVRRRTKNRTSLVVWAAAIALAGACSGPASPTPGSTGGPSPSRATASVGARPSASVAASQPEVVLRPVDGAPLDETIVRSLVSTPSGFAAIGMAASGGSPAPFVLMGSPDGRRWERVTTGPSGPAFTYLAGGPLGWIASSTGAGGSLGTTALWFSTDGVAWERVADTSGSAMADLSNSETNPLSAGPVGFAIVGQVTEAGSSVSAAWFSRDGRTWTEAVSLHDRNVDRVLQVPAGFVAIAAGCCAGPETVAFSTDGRAWRDLATDPGSPFDPAAGQALISTAGSSIVALRSDPGGIGAFSGDTANAAGGAAIAWRHAASTDAAFDGAAVSTMIGGNGGALALGFGRASLRSPGQARMGQPGNGRHSTPACSAEGFPASRRHVARPRSPRSSPSPTGRMPPVTFGRSSGGPTTSAGGSPLPATRSGPCRPSRPAPAPDRRRTRWMRSSPCNRRCGRSASAACRSGFGASSRTANAAGRRRNRRHRSGSSTRSGSRPSISAGRSCRLPRVRVGSGS